MKGVYETEIEKKKKCPLHFTTFLPELKMENIYIPKMTQPKCLYSHKKHTFSTIAQFSVAVFCLEVQSIVFYSTVKEGKSNSIIAKIVHLKCLQNCSCCYFAIQAPYCLVNLWILSGRFPLDSSSTADSSWLFCREQAGADCGSGQSLLFAWSLRPGPHQHRVRLSLCPCRSPLCSSSVIPALLQTCSTDIFKNSGIHPQYGFLLIIAGEDCTYYWLSNPMTICTAFSSPLHLVKVQQ